MAPKVDKCIGVFLGRHMPKELDGELTKIQNSMLAVARTLVSAWNNLLGEGIKDDSSTTVPTTEVVAMTQHTLCLIGTASERVSQTGQARILEVIDPSWKFSEDDS